MVIFAAYVGLYLLFAIVALRDSVNRRGVTLLWFAEVVASALTVVGLLLYHSDVEGDGLRLVWRAVSLSLLLFFIVMSLVDAHSVHAERESDLSDREHAAIEFAGIGLAWVVEAPALWMNLVFAFGEHVT